MTSTQRTIVIAAVFVILVACFGAALVFQWWSIMTMTRVGTVGTLTGCVTFSPLMVLGNALGLISAFRKELGKPRMWIFLFIIVANAILILSGTTAIIGTINSLSEHISYFTPRPEDIAWDEWLTLFLTFVGPEVLAMMLAGFGLVATRRRYQQAEGLPETVEEPQGETSMPE